MFVRALERENSEIMKSVVHRARLTISLSVVSAADRFFSNRFIVPSPRLMLTLSSGCYRSEQCTPRSIYTPLQHVDGKGEKKRSVEGH